MKTLPRWLVAVDVAMGTVAIAVGLILLRGLVHFLAGGS